MITELKERELLKELDIISGRIEKILDKAEKVECHAIGFLYQKPTHKKQKRILRRRRKRATRQFYSKMRFYFNLTCSQTKRGDKLWRSFLVTNRSQYYNP